MKLKVLDWTLFIALLLVLTGTVFADNYEEPIYEQPTAAATFTVTATIVTTSTPTTVVLPTSTLVPPTNTVVVYEIVLPTEEPTLVPVFVDIATEPVEVDDVVDEVSTEILYPTPTQTISPDSVEELPTQMPDDIVYPTPTYTSTPAEE